MGAIPKRCPLGHEWLTWGCSDVPRGGLRPEVHARVERDRKAGDGIRSVTRTISVDWIEDTSLAIRFIDHPHRLRADAWHRHADLTFNGIWVHVDLFGGNGSGPGFGFRDERIYLDGELAGRGWSLGVSLGGGGVTQPAMALLREDLALQIVWKEQVVQLVARKEPGVTRRLRKLRD